MQSKQCYRAMTMRPVMECSLCVQATDNNDTHTHICLLHNNSDPARMLSIDWCTLDRVAIYIYIFLIYLIQKRGKNKKNID